jgi:glutathione peroxidase
MAQSIYEFKIKSLQGKEIDFQNYKNKVILIVNTASKCGYTPQYAGLQSLYLKYKDSGLVILGFPCNQFGGQEPGDKDEIQNSCLINFGVSFPIFEKVEVNGANAHPLFDYVKNSLPGIFGIKRIPWNFTKFLFDKNGKPIKRFATITKPEKIEADIQKLL